MRSATVRAATANWLILAALFITIFGGKLRFIDRAGSDLPSWDQWDTEGSGILVPYDRGELQAAHLFAAHNEHRVVPTRVLALGLIIANGQWDARLECVVNALLHTLLGVAIFAYGRRLLQPPWINLWAVCILAMFAAPMSWQNVLGGFHTAQTFVTWFSLVAISLLIRSVPYTPRWWAGLVCAVAAIFSLGSGFLASIAVGLATFVATPVRELFRRKSIPLVLCMLVATTGFLVLQKAGQHEFLMAGSLEEFVVSFWHNLQWPVRGFAPFGLIAWAPWTWLTWQVWKRGDASTQDDRLLVGAGAWVLLQFAASAYARGVGGAWPSNRYFDTIALGLLVNLLVVFLAFSQRRLRSPWIETSALAAMVGIALLALGWWMHVGQTLGPDARSIAMEARARESTVAAYLNSGDPVVLRTQPIPYPDPEALRQWLDMPAIRKRLPASVLSSGGDSTRTMAWGSATAWHLVRSGRILFWVGVALLGVSIVRSFRLGSLFTRLARLITGHFAAAQPGRTIFSSVTCTLVAIVITWLATIPDDPAYLEADITASRPGTFEIFGDQGDGFRQDYQWGGELDDASTHRVRLKLRPGTYRAIRFDPLDRGATTRVDRAQVIDPAGNVLCQVTPSMFTAGPEIARLEYSETGISILVTVDGTDPQVFIRPPEPISTDPHRGWSPHRLTTLAVAAGLAGLLLGPIAARLSSPGRNRRS